MNSEPPFDDHSHMVGPQAESQSAQIRLELPSVKYIDSFFQAMTEFERVGDHQYSKSMTREQFPGYVQKLHDLAAGKDLKAGHIPSMEFWIIDDDGYAGRIILGLSFTPSPERVGHHVGYAVRPSKRRKGYATKALQCLLDEARKLKIYKLMPTCGPANIASRKVIERNGGVLLGGVSNDDARNGELRFLIDLEAEPAALNSGSDPSMTRVPDKPMLYSRSFLKALQKGHLRSRQYLVASNSLRSVGLGSKW
ncbi:MAG: GNAT family N-acetyltransferase [Fimbriimonas sp.]|nr:GNAT family N-acetyltransferase [Fimbriimonas sp.]